ncbi:MAG TPA: hypothetical protein VEA59_07360 [Patescibacteria group bacterium]|nr:hypothetical protein [Patescibacteria group bacterium]
MRIIIYYLLLLVLLGLIGGYTASAVHDPMSMTQIVSIVGVLALYSVGISLVGEIKSGDERDMAHRFTASRHAFIAGVATLSLGLLYDLIQNHQLNNWLLAVLIVMNLTKIVSLIWQDYKK